MTDFVYQNTNSLSKRNQRLLVLIQIPHSNELPKLHCFSQYSSPFLICLFGSNSGIYTKFVYTKVHNGNISGGSCLTSSEIVTVQLNTKVTLSSCLTFALLGI